MMKGMKKALSLLVCFSMVAGLFTSVPPSTVRAETGGDNGEAGIVVDYFEGMDDMSEGAAYLMVTEDFKWNESGPVSLEADGYGNQHYKHEWYTSYGETHPAKLALLTAHAGGDTEEENESQWEWLAEEISIKDICVKDSEGNEIANGEGVVSYGTYGSFYPEDENAGENDTDTFLFLGEGRYWISYTKDEVEYQLPIETVAPELGFYSAKSITADNMLRDEITYSNEGSKEFFAGLSLDSNEVKGYEILWGIEESYCEVSGERKDIEEFLTINSWEEKDINDNKQIMIPLTVKDCVPTEFWMHLAVELTYKDAQRDPEVRDCGIRVFNAGNKLQITDWIAWREEGQVSIQEDAEYSYNWNIGMDDGRDAAFRLSDSEGKTVLADELKLVGEWGDSDVAILERDEEETEEKTSRKTAIIKKLNDEGSIVNIKFLEMGDFYFQYEGAAVLYVHVGLPELGIYMYNDFSVKTYAWSQYELSSDTPEKALYVMLQTGDWHKEIKDDDVKFSVYRDWEHRDTEPENPLENREDYIKFQKIEDSPEDMLVYEVTFNDKVPGSFLLDVEVKRTNKSDGEECPISRSIEVKVPAKFVVDWFGDKETENNKTYLMMADWFKDWGESGPADLEKDEDGNHHYSNIWYTSYGETHPAKLALLTAYSFGTEEGENEWEWSLAEEISIEDICVKDSEGKEIANGEGVVSYGTYGSFYPEDENAGENNTATFLFLKEGSYYISYTKNGKDYQLPIELGAPELGFYSAESITADNMLGDEITYTDENSKKFFAGLSLDSNEVKGYRILMESEEGKKDWEYSYCEVPGERKDIDEFLTIGEKKEKVTGDNKQIMIPLTVNEHVPTEFWMHLAVELTYKDVNRSPEVRTRDIRVYNAGNKLQITDWIDWQEDGQVSIAENAEYFNDWNTGMDDQIWVAFQLSNQGETTVPTGDLALVDAKGNRLEVAVLERDDEETEENTKEKAAIMRKLNADGSIVGIKFLRMGDFYFQYEGAAVLYVHVGLPELGIYTGNEFSEETYAWTQYELRSDAPAKALYVMLQTGEWHQTIKPDDVKLSVYRDWEHRFNVVAPEPDTEPERPLENSDYIAEVQKIDSQENTLVYKVTFKDEVPDSFLLEVRVERTNKDNEECPIGRLIEVEYVQAPAELTGIRITKQPLKTTYTVGETFDRTGMVVTAVYDDGKEETITDYEINPSGKLAKDDKTVTISYEGQSASLDITVKEEGKAPELTGIRIKNKPSKTTYTVGETFDKTGMVVTAVYDDGTEKEITGYEVNPSGKLTKDDQTVTISYEGKSASLSITVKEEDKAPELTGIRITKQPLKTTYTVGETFDKTGMVVTAVYDDGTEKVITDYVVNPSRSFTAGDKFVTISYKGKSASLNITVKEKAPEKVPEKKPAKQKGADIELDSMKYTVTDAKADGTGTVAYAGTSDKNAKTIKIPAVITDSETGVDYKVTSIKKNALKNSKALNSVTIGSNVTKIEDGAFSSCKKLKKITIPGSVTSIGKNAFKNCSAMTTVTIGKKVTSIGGSAFNGCKKLKSITIKSAVLKTVGSSAFKGIDGKATIKVPKKKRSAYKELIIKKGKAPKKVKIK